MGVRGGGRNEPGVVRLGLSILILSGVGYFMCWSVIQALSELHSYQQRERQLREEKGE